MVCAAVKTGRDIRGVGHGVRVVVASGRGSEKGAVRGDSAHERRSVQPVCYLTSFLCVCLRHFTIKDKKGNKVENVRKKEILKKRADRKKYTKRNGKHQETNKKQSSSKRVIN